MARNLIMASLWHIERRDRGAEILNYHPKEHASVEGQKADLGM